MFTMAKIKDGSTYLERHLSANDYYCENETVIGTWVGQGAKYLGLEGEIRAGDRSFENLRKNRYPNGVEKLTPRDSANRVKFLDFQCSAQKSVSIMAVTFGDIHNLLELKEREIKAVEQVSGRKVIASEFMQNTVVLNTRVEPRS